MVCVSGPGSFRRLTSPAAVKMSVDRILSPAFGFASLAGRRGAFGREVFTTSFIIICSGRYAFSASVLTIFLMIPIAKFILRDAADWLILRMSAAWDCVSPPK